MLKIANRREKGIYALFARYVSLNIVSIIAVSCYVLADTFFISRSGGPDGITVLNLCLPIYNIIYAIGAMIGTGSAIRFTIEKNEGRRSRYFTNALLWCLIFGLAAALIGGSRPDLILHLMGGDSQIVRIGIPYLRIFILFSPFFMANQVFTAFVRNDGAPALSMTATMSSSLFNILFDYIFVFPMGMGIAGAGLATAISPVVSISICCLHFLAGDNNLHIRKMLPDVRLLVSSCKLGISSFVAEMSQGVTTTLFNFLILGLEGNIGVAAYGIVANFSIVGTSLFNGLAQGTQPLISRFHLTGEEKKKRQILRLGIITALCIALLINLAAWTQTDLLISIFNSSRSAMLSRIAHPGLRIYFTGFLCSGLNIFLASSFSADDKAAASACVSLSRGFAAICAFALVLSRLFGMTGIWASYPAAEAFTLMLALGWLISGSRKK